MSSGIEKICKIYTLLIHFCCYIFYPYDCMDFYCKINVNLNDEETRLLFPDFSDAYRPFILGQRVAYL